MEKIEHLFFDLEGTLSDFEKCEIDALYKTFQENRIVFNEEVLNKYLGINSALWKQHEKGMIEQDKLLYFRFEILAGELNLRIDAKRVSEQYQYNLSNTFYFQDNALLVLETLGKEYNLYLMTNGKTRTQRERIRKAGIEGYFRDIFISEEVGFNKPKREFFQICFDRIGLKCKENAMIVGDSLTSDILGGYNAGIKTCWYNPHKYNNSTDIEFDFEITDLKQLLMII